MKVLEFVDGGNYVYKPMPYAYGTGKDGEIHTYQSFNGDLAELGYKYAFRKSPIAKSKQFRYGIFKESNVGFVYEVED